MNGIVGQEGYRVDGVESDEGAGSLRSETMSVEA